MQKREKIYTILIGGQAGDGAREAGGNLSRLLNKLGYYVFSTVEYPSLIRGGHNYCRVSFSKEKIFSDYLVLDAVVALNQETIDLHQKELKKDGVIFFDNVLKGFAGKPGKNISLPISSYAKEASVSPIMRTAVALGAICYYFDFDLTALNKVFEEVFGSKAGQNIELAKKGFDYLKGLKILQPQIDFSLSKERGMMLDGNTATAEGMVKAGMKNYIAYPMTPATSILHYLAKVAKEHNLKVTQAESELAVINMALGSAYGGARTATGSSGGGFALMLEALSMAGMAEIPIVVVESQRPGPSTGVPTRTAQGDLNFVRRIPGEFPRIVLAPGDQEEAYEMGGKAMNLAWKYQLPVVVMLDKHLSESSMNADLKNINIKEEKTKFSKGGPEYKRYALGGNGVSPLCLPGTLDTVVKVNSYEHDESGLINENSVITQQMYEKRFFKTKELEKEMKDLDGVRVYGDKKSKNVLLFWGSTKGAVLEAIKYTKKSVKAVQILAIEPLPADLLKKVLQDSKKSAVVELNFGAQLKELICEKIGIDIKNKILKYDTCAFEPMDLAKRIDKIF